MMAQNRAAQRDKAESQHQYEHQEKKLRENTELTRLVHEQAVQIAELVAAIDTLRTSPHPPAVDTHTKEQVSSVVGLIANVAPAKASPVQ